MIKKRRKKSMNDAVKILYDDISVENFDSKLGLALNAYQRNYDFKDSKNFLIEFRPDIKKSLESVSEKQFFNFISLGFTCKFLIDNDFDQFYHQETGEWIDKKIEELLTLKKENKELPSESPNNRRDVQKAILNQLREKLGEIDNHFDEYFDFIWKGSIKNEFDIIEYIKGCEFSTVHIRKIYNHYYEHLEDLKTALNCTIVNKYNADGLIGEVSREADLKEGYKFLGNKKLKKIIEFYENELQKLDTYIKLNSTRRQTNTKKPSLKKLVSKVKYLKQSEELGITSLTPDKIVGNNYVFLYNTKNKKLTMMKANDISGFSIKGTTIFNYNESSSFSKTIRKNVDIATFVKSSKAKTIEAFEGLTTNSTPASGRINSDTIILSVFK